MVMPFLETVSTFCLGVFVCPACGQSQGELLSLSESPRWAKVK